jgi:hypothetical protein
MLLDKFPRDYPNFLKAWHYRSNMELVPVEQVSKDMATTTGFTVAFDFSSVPDLPLIELAATLIKQLPENFVFIKSRYGLITESVKNFCQQVGRNDISFVEIDGDIDASWWEHAKETYFINDPVTLHEMSTAARLCQEGRLCGRIGHFIGFHDAATALKTSTAFHGATPNWQIVFPYNELPVLKQSKDLRENFIAPNFLLLLLKAFLKEIKLDTMAHVYRMFTVNKFGPVGIAMMLSPNILQDLTSLSVNTPPFYPGLIVRDLQGCYIPPNIIFEGN